ncbi:MAG TPA: saccharopine dehydrogenase NADP-binding domain-containing protein [Thermoanaerobaculia bacterium]|nr:saccharopine dehydrogenase NADP-binding domain-containing protein [Thermoanaerobaculia bacterium]
MTTSDPASQAGSSSAPAGDSSPPRPGDLPRARATGWMIYGANGFTGELVAREAVRRGLAPILTGRNEAALAALGGELGLPVRVFALDDPAALRGALAREPAVAAVLHCAGPFVRTSAPMVGACLAAGVHYLDITGEIAVFEAVLAEGLAAQEAGIVLLPGVGFDVVPTDCLAARLADALVDATELALAFASDRGTYSRGTLKTMIEGLPNAGAVRRGGRIVPVPIAYDVREIEFSCGRRWAMTIPWGDVATAYHTTGIPNIRVYTAAPRGAIRRARRLAPLLPLAAWWPVKRLLQRVVDARVTGPEPEVQKTARVYLWGEARNAAGATVSATLETPEAYHLTAVSAVTVVERVLAGKVAPGSWTPGRALGPHFAAELPGVIEGELRRSP